MNALEARKAVQKILLVAEDGVIGPKTLQALTLLCSLPADAAWPANNPTPHFEGIHPVTASSFADPADVAAFTHCKASGYSDLACFARGDNGVGKWGDDCSSGSGPACALPPEDWHPFGDGARKKKVNVVVGEKSVICELRDTMPHKDHITNGAGIDLSPDACAELGLHPPVMVEAAWSWVA